MCTYSTYLCLGLYPVLLFWYFFAQEISLFFEVYPSSSRPFTLEIYFSKQLLFHFKGVCLFIFVIQFSKFQSIQNWITFHIIGLLFFLIHMNFSDLDDSYFAIQFDFCNMDTIHFLKNIHLSIFIYKIFIMSSRIAVMLNRGRVRI